MDWSREGKKSLGELRIDPRQVTPLVLRAVVNWLKEGLDRKPGRPVEAIYGNGRGIEVEDGTVVRKSKGWIYDKVLNRVADGQFDWTFSEFAVDDAPSQSRANDEHEKFGAEQQASLNHWEDLRAISKEMAQQISVQIGKFGWVIPTTSPRGEVARKLWEDLHLHTAGHPVWTLFKEFQELKDSASELRRAAQEEAAQLGRGKTWNEQVLRDALSRALFNPEPVKLGTRDDSEGIDFQHIWASQANAIRELRSVKELASVVGRLKEVHPDLLDSLASLEVRRQFAGNCPDCPGSMADDQET